MKRFGPTTSDAFSSVLNVLKSYISIKQLSRFLNSDTRRKLKYHNEIERSVLITKFIESRPEDWDPDALILSNVTLLFESTNINAGTKGVDLCGSFRLPTLNCRVESGQVVVLKGEGSAGKTTLLRLIAKQLIPTQGFVYFPENWRVRFLRKKSGIFRSKLW